MFALKKRGAVGRARLPTGAWRGIVLGCLALAAGVQMMVVGPVMHEADQASLVGGAWKLAAAESGIYCPGFYNYDKQYGSYWLLAAALKFGPAVDPILLTNWVSFGLFWLAAGILFWTRPPKSFAQFMVCLAVMLAPALWQHSAFAASNFLAAGFLFLAFSFWRSGFFVRELGGALLFAMAVASRGDVLALLPACVWALSVRQSPLRWTMSRAVLLVGVLGAAAFLAGRILSNGESIDFYPPFFNPKIFAAYVIFGLGAASLVFVGWIFRWGVVAFRREQIWQRVFYMAGALAFVPILGFYSIQMFSTRHWVTALAALAGCCLVRRTERVLRVAPLHFLTAVVLILATVLPLVIGLRLPFPDSPRLVFGEGTAFPTADGTVSMGGYVPRILAMRASGFRHDHNQAVWEAARDADYQPGADGRVAVLGTSMGSYYELAFTFRGLAMKEATESDPGFYLDSRSALRGIREFGKEVGVQPTLVLLTRKTGEVSQSFDGISMLYSSRGSPVAGFVRLAAISQMFKGNEFRRLPDPLDLLAPQWHGHAALVVSDQPLPDGGGGERISFVPPEGGEKTYGVRIPAREIDESLRAWLKVCGDAGAEGVVSILPEYMAVERF